MRTMLRRLSYRKLGVAVCAVALSFLAAYPVWWMLASSLLPEGTSQAMITVMWPAEVSGEAYVAVLEEKPVAQWLYNTFLTSTGATVVAVSVAVLAAYAITRFQFKGKRWTLVLLIVMQMMPASSLIIPLFLMFKGYGLLDTLTAVGISYTSFTVPFAIWMLWGYLQSIPEDFEDAAMVDGCTRTAAFLRVTLPLAAPGIVATALFAFEQGWNQYLLPFILTSDRAKWVVSLGLYSFIGQYIAQVEQMMAASLIATVPPLAVFIILQRRLVGGLALGGVKG